MLLKKPLNDYFGKKNIASVIIACVINIVLNITILENIDCTEFSLLY